MFWESRVHFHDIGDYLSREDKLERVSSLASVAGISSEQGWQIITPDEHGDWLKQRDDGFKNFIVMGDKKSDDVKLFDTYSLGVATGRDAWTYNLDRNLLIEKIEQMVDFYNNELARFNRVCGDLAKKDRELMVDGFLNTDPTKISWTRALKKELAKDRKLSIDEGNVVVSLYRPYHKQWIYHSRQLNEMIYQMPRIFPNAAGANKAIMVKGNWRGEGQFTLMVDSVTCLQPDGGGQCFPLYLYDEVTPAKTDNSNQSGLFDSEEPETQYQRRDAITDEGLQHFLDAYPGEQISKEDIFYYVYGLLHSQTYRDRYADNLSKELPRIPCVKTPEGFWGFSKAGRDLAEIHLNYETVELYKATVEEKGDKPGTSTMDRQAYYRVERMKHPKVKNDEGKSVNDLTRVIYNPRISVSDIPVEAYDYVVNGKPAIEWVIERQCVKTDKTSGIVNDANDWANETMNNPRYPLDLLLRVITVSLKTNEIVASLPALDIDSDDFIG